jgi:hypothetical protein
MGYARGRSGSRYTDGANGKSIRRQSIETYVLVFEPVADTGSMLGFNR